MNSVTLWWITITCSLCLTLPALAKPLLNLPSPPLMEAFLAPKGGFASSNRDRTILLPDGKAVPATLENAVLNLIRRSGQGAAVRMAMYSFSTKHIQNELLAAAERGADVKIVLDGVNTFAEEARTAFLTKLKEQKSPIQVKVILPETMKRFGRVYRHADGQEFAGSMHEKFGVFINPGEPSELFVGSANLSYSSDSMFAENRITAKGDAYLEAALRNEFATLWQEYGTCATDTCVDEASCSLPPTHEVTLITNSQTTGSRTNMLQSTVTLMTQAKRPHGSLDIAMFYFTQRAIADALLDIARQSPTTKIRLLLDQEQVDREEDQEILSEWLDQIITQEKLSNLEIHVRWDAKAYGWDTTKTPPQPAKIFKNAPFLMHHKFFIINGETLVNGSFNWTDLGDQNLENLLIIPAKSKATALVVKRFQAEFEELWSQQSITTVEARKLKAALYHQLLQAAGERKTSPLNP